MLRAFGGQCCWGFLEELCSPHLRGDSPRNGRQDVYPSIPISPRLRDAPGALTAPRFRAAWFSLGRKQMGCCTPPSWAEIRWGPERVVQDPTGSLLPPYYSSLFSASCHWGPFSTQRPDIWSWKFPLPPAPFNGLPFLLEKDKITWKNLHGPLWFGSCPPLASCWTWLPPCSLYSSYTGLSAHLHPCHMLVLPQDLCTCFSLCAKCSLVQLTPPYPGVLTSSIASSRKPRSGQLSLLSALIVPSPLLSEPRDGWNFRFMCVILWLTCVPHCVLSSMKGLHLFLLIPVSSVQIQVPGIL